MSKIDDAVRSNPAAAEELLSMKDAMEALAKLREAGVAKGAVPLAAPHSGRYGDLPAPLRVTAKPNKYA